MSASRSRSSAEVRSPTAIPMLAVTVTRISLSAPSLNGCLSASSRRSRDQLGAGLQRDLLGDHDELIPAQTTQRVPAAHHAVEACRDRPQQFVAGRVPERVVDVLEVVQIDEQRRHRHVWCEASARASARRDPGSTCGSASPSMRRVSPGTKAPPHGARAPRRSAFALTRRTRTSARA